MNYTFSRRAALTLALALPLVSCETLGITGDQVTTTLNAVAALTGEVAKWNADPQGNGKITDAALQQLSDYSAKSGDLGNVLSTAIDAVAPGRKEQLEPIVNALASLSGHQEQNLKKLDQGQRKLVTSSFTASAVTLSQLVKTQLEQAKAVQASSVQAK